MASPAFTAAQNAELLELTRQRKIIELETARLRSIRLGHLENGALFKSESISERFSVDIDEIDSAADVDYDGMSCFKC